MYKISKETQDEMAAYSANLGRVLNDIRLVKSSNGQAKERKRGKKRIVALFRYGLKEAKVQAVVSPLMTYSDDARTCYLNWVWWCYVFLLENFPLVLSLPLSFICFKLSFLLHN